MKGKAANSAKLGPVIKWAGSKRELVNELYSRRPLEFKDYYEPFSGSLAFALRLYQDMEINSSQMFLGDISKPLITTYEVIRDDLEALLSSLDSPEYSWCLDKNERAEAYHCIRESFNQLLRQDTLEHPERIKLATEFLYLIKTNYNGLYRVNKKGEYNASVDLATEGEKKIFDGKALKVMSGFLNKEDVTVFHGSYEILVETAKAGDFIYFDPPYDTPFTQYDKAGFSWTDQKKLKRTVDILHKRGCYVMISQGATKRIKELYKDYHQDFVTTRNLINCNAKGRKEKNPELIIRNYKMLGGLLKM
ncbi:hypothetical protein HK097_009154 [Rhizophlyctis rosea]|uniref:site-specific DNA-methyltransferase (adenine-specific) n=1 Tax=Rhizophlyctis rosea TaxID=64517 RepID=A0AAD5X433_9FUNG|nr:hypothetical protein HK097_009154 [Rhizophlyctis rosea]